METEERIFEWERLRGIWGPASVKLWFTRTPKVDGRTEPIAITITGASATEVARRIGALLAGG